MSMVLHPRSTHAQAATVLERLAERWRALGVALSCYKPDGTLLWRDARMPRLFSLFLEQSDAVARFIAGQPHTGAPAAERVAELSGLQLFVVPVLRKRRITAWLCVLARVGTITPTEDLQRTAGRAHQDLGALLATAQRWPALPAAQLPGLVSLVQQMHEDLSTAAVAQQDASSVTGQLTAVYEEISLLYKISSQMRVSRKPQDFLESVCRDMQDIGNFHSVAVAYASREEESALPVIGELAVQVGRCGLSGQELINALHAPLLNALRLGEAQVHNDLSGASDASRLSPYMTRFVCMPLMREQRPLGVLLVVDKSDGLDFNMIDLKLLANVASQCSMFLENAALFSDMEGLFMGVLHALTKAIDAKDTYTRGHSQRVADLSRQLAEKIGLSNEQCERVYLSGLLHDVGKIGVPEAVLTKPGKLTDAEFEAIKRHPAIGAEILGNIKQLQDILPGVLYHHERWDGRGYPYKLSGESIPLLGRIICVADSFDAMSSTRTYRPALALDHTLAEIQRCAGSQFDPALAKVFLSLNFEPYRRAVQEEMVPPPQGAPSASTQDQTKSGGAA